MTSKKGKFEAPIPGPSSNEASDEYSSYDQFADKVGLVPNVRKDDNKLQTKLLLITWLICIVVGAIWGKTDGAIMGALLGLVVALLVSGGVLMVVGLLRK